MGFCGKSEVKPNRSREIKILPMDEVDFDDTNTVQAVESGDMADFQKMYLRDPNFVHYKGPTGQTLMHHAALKDRLSMLKLILHCGGDLNAQDNEGNTAMHAAVEGESLECLEFMINKGADSTIKNKRQWAIVHYAVELKKPAVLQLLVRYNDKVDLFQGGIHGRIPIHLAAIYNDTDAADILWISEMAVDVSKLLNVNSMTNQCQIEETLSSRIGRLLTHHCGNGFTAVHKAVRNAADKMLKLLLKSGEQMGFTRPQMMSFLDSHGQTPLHCAVHSGEIKIVRLCLENGARIGVQQRDMTSPVHLACSQGNLELVRMLFVMSPEEKTYCLHLCDTQGMTPLHYAAMFDHMEIASYLLEEGANIDANDSEMRTPMLLAAARSCWGTVQTLLQLGADVTVKDKESRNLIHLIITHGGSLEDFVQEIRTVNHEHLDHLLNDRDAFGCTPLHYASRIGKFKSTESLIQLGAKVTLRDRENKSALHFACKYGRYNTVLQLLHGDRGLAIINEIDGGGMTPLHIASEYGHIRIVQLLLNRGALLQRDHLGKSALHLATKNGYIQTMNILLGVHVQLLDLSDKSGETCLHIAAWNNRPNAITLLLNMDCKFTVNARGMTPMDLALHKKHHEAASALATNDRRAQEILRMSTEKSAIVIDTLIATMPDVFLAVLEKCVIESEESHESPEYFIKYDFEYLQFAANSIEKLRVERKGYQPQPLPAMNTMVKHRRLDLLLHPVCQQYIQMKWNAYGMYIHMANVSFYIVFMALLTTVAGYLIFEINRPLESYRMQLNGSQADPQSRAAYLKQACNQNAIGKHVYIIASTVLAFAIINELKEIIQFYQQGLKYLLDPINYLEWLLYVATLLSVIPIFDCHAMSFQLEYTAVAVFVAWFNFLLYLQRFEMVGLYVVMFLEILKTLVKALLIFSILLVAFALAFHILLSRDHIGFTNMEVSFIRVFSMMLGEFDFLDTFLTPFVDENSSYEDLPQFILGFLVIFMVLMPILLVNLLIGLAVGDIEVVRRNAHLKRVAMQVELHTELERKLPRFILASVDKEELITYPNELARVDRHPKFLVKLHKWLGTINAMSNSKATAANAETHRLHQGERVMEAELERQKLRMKDLSSAIDQVHSLLKVVAKKLEIRTSADDCDEGGSEEGNNKDSSLSADPQEKIEKSFAPTIIVRSKLKSAGGEKSEENF